MFTQSMVGAGMLSVLMVVAVGEAEACATCDVEGECAYATSGGAYCEIFFEVEEGGPEQYCNWVGSCGPLAMLPGMTPAGTVVVASADAPAVLECSGFVVIPEDASWDGAEHVVLTL